MNDIQNPNMILLNHPKLFKFLINYISSTNNSFSTKTDRKGQFTLPNAAVYFFSKEGYITQKVNITEKKTIELTPCLRRPRCRRTCVTGGGVDCCVRRRRPRPRRRCLRRRHRCPRVITMR
mgnify:CR=1 FL=1